ALPSVDAILRAGRPAANERGRCTRAARDGLTRARAERTSGDAATFAAQARAALAERERLTLRSVINATGVVLQTNLGRAPLSPRALAAIAAAAGAVSVEYDLVAGKRGERHGHAARLLADLASAEDAVVVNNNAAAVLLALAALASRKEVIVARGELVEIGGGFRIPDVLRRSGAKLIEVGTTNRTYARDYAAAIGAKTGAILRAHPLMRAVRPDKLTIAALLATLESYRDGTAEKDLPVWRMIAAPPRAIAARARSLAASLGEAGIPAEAIEVRSTVGGGSLPEETQP